MSVDLSEGNENMDYPQHTQTYDLFIALVKWGSYAVIAILFGMWLFLV
ncbi:MAG: aa3-type cytochrome c oxidase subunit IV [Rhodomicrobiaceae bacterium]